MKRLALVFVVTAALSLAAGSASQTQACHLLKMLLHRCHACHFCGHYKCQVRRCDRPKCGCHPHHHHHHHHHRRVLPPVFFGPPAYPEQFGPMEYEPLPRGRAF